MLLADTSIISADLSKSTLDLFSPPKSKQHAQTLLFGPSSEEQSSEDEIGTKNSILSSPPYTRYLFDKYITLLFHVLRNCFTHYVIVLLLCNCLVIHIQQNQHYKRQEKTLYPQRLQSWLPKMWRKRHSLLEIVEETYLDPARSRKMSSMTLLKEFVSN